MNIIEKVISDKESKCIVNRIAKGTVNDKEIRLIIIHSLKWFDKLIGIKYCVGAEIIEADKAEVKVFRTKHSTNKYFDELVKKYNLKEEVIS